MNWIDHIQYSDYDIDFAPNKVGALGLLKFALKNPEEGKCLYSESFNGGINPEVKTALEHQKFFLNYLSDLKARPLYRRINPSGLGKHFYVFDDGLIEINTTPRYFSFEGFCYRESVLKYLKDYIKEYQVFPDPVGQVYAIVNSNGRPALSSIGTAGIALCKDNYTEEVISGYEHIVQDLKSKDPSGRVAIFEGVPGSGKTHLVRSLLLDLPDATFVLIQPDMIVNMSGPDLLPLLISHRGNTNSPMIMVLEDADKCLVKRASDNMSSIQALLNLGDGILGSVLDIRIVATTNATKLEIEPAILRPGRLSKRVEVQALPSEFAINLFKKLVPEAELHHDLKNEKERSLAEVYSFARQSGWVPQERKASPEDDEDDDDDDE